VVVVKFSNQFLVMATVRVLTIQLGTYNKVKGKDILIIIEQICLGRWRMDGDGEIIILFGEMKKEKES